MKNKKILLIHNIITPTRTLLFNKLHEKFTSQGNEFKIIFTAETEGNRSWKTENEIKKFDFEYEILDSTQIQNKSKKDKHFFHINKGMTDLLNKKNPDIIIHAGWAGSSAFVSNYWCKKNNKKFILRAGSTKYENSWRRTLTKPLIKWLVKNSNGYLAYGTRAGEYLESLGADKEKIQKLYNTVDIDFFLHEAERLKPTKQEFKKKYGIKTKYTILYVGRFENGKGVFELLEGFEKFQKTNPDISLVFVGDGSEKEKLEQIIQEKDIQNVIFPGFIQIDKISELYTIADIFTLPSSEEVWGLVINEAMCFGLPILSAYRVGAVEDLIQEGKNGYIMKKNTGDEVFTGIQYIFDNNLIENNNSLEIIKDFKVDDIVERLEF